MADETPGPVDISASNVRGTGATQLVLSLLPALEAAPDFRVGRIVLPAGGPVADYARQSPGEPPRRYRRRLPNAMSRAAECLFSSGGVSTDRPVLVLGDLPLRHRARQVVLVHTPHLIPGARSGGGLARLKYAISRLIFRLNLRFIDHAIVQTEAMREALSGAYPALTGRIVVIPQPPPQWLLGAKPKRAARAAGGLRLFFPGAAYPHKNHELLRALAKEGLDPELVERIVITVDGPGPAGLDCIGLIGAEAMIAQYGEADALLFPSHEESYGLPLVEAMYLGLPIVCADRPYARALCGDDALYFDPDSTSSLRAALTGLKARLDAGWRPDWSERLKPIPESWADVAERIAALFAAR